MISVTTTPLGTLARLFEWIAPARGTPIETRRQRILTVVLLTMAMFGLIAYVPGVYITIAAGEYAVDAAVAS